MKPFFQYLPRKMRYRLSHGAVALVLACAYTTPTETNQELKAIQQLQSIGK